MVISIPFKEIIGKLIKFNAPAVSCSCSPPLSLIVFSKCSAASATKETPAIAAFSHFLYADDEAPAKHCIAIQVYLNLNGKKNIEQRECPYYTLKALNINTKQEQWEKCKMKVTITNKHRS